MKIRNLLVNGIVLGATVVTLTGITTSNLWADDAAKGIYDDKCAGCHGPAGKGDGPAGAALPVKPADLSTSKGKDDNYLTKIIKDGGEAVSKSPAMPANSDLTDAQIKSLVDYIKHF